MTLQGYFQAAETGATPTWMSATAIQMTAWQERAVAGFVGWWTGRVPWTGLPRGVVLSALQETGRHPEVFGKRPVELMQAETVWTQMRDAQLAWTLQHGEVVAGIVAGEAEPGPKEAEITAATTAAEEAQKWQCWRPEVLKSFRCVEKDRAATAATAALERLRAQRAAWDAVLQVPPLMRARDWLTAIESTQSPVVTAWTAGLRSLYNHTGLTDPRVETALNQSIVLGNGDALLRSLLEGELWSQLLLFAQNRETRVRSALLGSGYMELWTLYDKLRTSTTRGLVAETDRQRITDWFDEIAGRSWWVNEETVGHMRRCLSVETGECARIGPTEIEALSAQILERGRIAADWSRRLFLAMWSALPAVGLLFLLEVVVLGFTLRASAAGGVNIVRLELPAAAPLQLPQESRPMLGN